MFDKLLTIDVKQLAEVEMTEAKREQLNRVISTMETALEQAEATSSLAVRLMLQAPKRKLQQFSALDEAIQWAILNAAIGSILEIWFGENGTTSEH